MSTRYLRKESGTSKMADRSTDAPVQYDTADGFVKYGDGSKIRQLQAPGKPLAPIPVTTATLTLAPDTHDGRLVRIDVASGVTFTLPAATGSGARYQIIVGVAQSSNSVVLKVANASDYLRGFAYTTQDAGGAGIDWATANTGTVSTESDTLTWNRTTTGLGAIGDYIEVIDIAANIWAIETAQNSNGTEQTPFSAGV